MEEGDTDQEILCHNQGADSFRDLLKGDIDIIEYLNSGPGSVCGASLENACGDDDVKVNVTARMDINALLMGDASVSSSNVHRQQQQHHDPQQQQQQQQHNNGQSAHVSQQQQQTSHHMQQMPMLHAAAGGSASIGRPPTGAPVAAAAIYGQQQHQQQQQPHGYHRTSQERPPYEHHAAVRLPDSPPETDSGAGSAGSPSGSETGPYSPEFQQFQRQQQQLHQAHAAALAAGVVQQGSVIHSPVVGGSSMPGTSGQQQQVQVQPGGVILNVHGLDHLTQAVVNDYLPLQQQGNTRQVNNNHANGHLTPSAVDYFAVAAVAAGQGGANASVQPPPSASSVRCANSQETSPNGPSSSSASYTPYVLPSLHPAPYPNSSSTGPLQRKRTRTDSTAPQFVKPEPTSPTTHASEESLFYEDSLSGHQAIRFNEFQKEQWHVLCNSHGRELQSLGFAVVADKGFNYSQFDTSFVNQKKNHFQISVHIEVRDPLPPKYVKVPGENGGLKAISQFQLDFYGVKAEMLSSVVQIKQSQTDRKPICYEPVTLELPANRVTKVTVARLHFSETTMNNQRKNGRPNPDQKYFYLVGALNAVTQTNEKFPIMAYNSERVIVRASNPGQFDNGDSEVHWQKGQTANSIFHPGPVGVGTDKPTSALTVTGDISCTGTVYHPSDERLKQNIKEVNCADALSKLSQIRVVQYEIRPEIAAEWGLSEDERQRIGVIAQEVENIIPDAVKENGAYLTVDDNRIFYESAAAVKELCRLTGNLEYKVEEVEKISKKLSKLSHLRRLDSIRSTCSNSTCDSGKVPSSYVGSYVSCSKTTVGADSPPLNRKDKKSSGGGGGGKKTDEEGGAHRRSSHRHHHHHHHVCRRFNLAERGACDNKAIQSTIIVLVAIMAFCLLAMATLYILDWHKRNNSPSPSIAAVHQIPIGAGGGTSTTSRTNGPSSSSSGDRQDSELGFMKGPGAGGKTTTPPTTPNKYTSVLPPPLEVQPCVKLPCVEFCCPNANSYYVVVNKHDDERLETNSSAVSEDPAVPSWKARDDKATVILISRTVDGPPVGISFRDKFSDMLPSFLNPKSTVNHRPIAVGESRSEPISVGSARGNETPKIDLLPKFTILGVNMTIDGQYCLGDSCVNPYRGNFTYYIPISKYMPHIPLEIKFSIQENQILQYCWKSTGDYCHGIEESYFVETFSGSNGKRAPRSVKNGGVQSSDVYRRRVDTWELPIGMYQSGMYSFRAGSSTTLCSLADDEAGVTFVEYNLHFYRTCT